MANPIAEMTITGKEVSGTVKVEIYLDRVPRTASNFIDLAESGFYNGIHFHRVIPDFMAQFGCPNAKAKDPKDAAKDLLKEKDPMAMLGGAKNLLKDAQAAKKDGEPKVTPDGTWGTGGPPDGTFKNLKTGATEKRYNGGCIMDENISRDTNAEGTLSMANTGSPNTNGSQFFINVANNDFLDWFSTGDSKHPVFGKVLDGMDVIKKCVSVPASNDIPKTPIKMEKIKITGLPDER